MAGARPVLSSEPLVEVGVISARGELNATALVCINWAGGPLSRLTPTLAFEPAPFTTATLASEGGEVLVRRDSSGRLSLTFDLNDTADTVMLRSTTD